MKITIKRSNIAEVIIAILILLPYFEDSAVNSKLTVVIGQESYLRPINIYMAIAIVLVAFSAIMAKGKYQTRNKKAYWIILFAIVSFLTSVIQTTKFSASLCTWIWLLEPIIYGSVVVTFCDRYKVSKRKVMRNMCVYFGAYCAYLLWLYIRLYSFSSGTRMSSRGGGPVIFGYTIAIMFSVLIAVKDEFNFIIFYILGALYTVTALATGTRGAIWPIVFLWICLYLFAEFNGKKLIITLMLIPIMIALMSINIGGLIGGSSRNISRVIIFEDLIRSGTAFRSIGIFGAQPLHRMLCGFGLGNFFPYQYWSLIVQVRWNNTFTYNGMSLLVQPHNSYIYALLETGIIGFSILFHPFFRILKEVLRVKDDSDRYYVLVIGVILFVNCFDSVFFVQPGVAGNIWIVLFFIFDLINRSHVDNLRG